MTERPLTQEFIDRGTDETTEDERLLSKAVQHPFLTGGALLAGAGLAYAAARIIATSHEESDTPALPAN